MIDIKQFNTETEQKLIEAVVAFNTDFKITPNDTMDKSYYQLWENHKEIELNIWRTFYTDKRVQTFYQKEFELGLKAKRNILLRKIGENNSTATVQGLMGILKREEENTNSADTGKIFIYSFIPLNQDEQHSEHVRILDNIPKEIRDALIITNGSNEKE